MLKPLLARYHQKHRTMAWPDGDPPPMPERFAGVPILKNCAQCPERENTPCMDVCPTKAMTRTPDGELQLDVGRCLFCRACERECLCDTVLFSNDWRMASNNRDQLIINAETPLSPQGRHDVAAKLFHRSFRLRQVSAGGCNACEADANVLNTIGWDLSRFGIQFVASPRHADGLLVTGPVTENMREALLKTWDALPAPRLVIACGACAISGGPFAENPELAHNSKGETGVGAILPVHLYVPGCPPHPMTLLDGLLRLIGRIPE